MNTIPELSLPHTPQPDPPSYLGKEGRRLWTVVHREFEVVDVVQRTTLEAACLALDRMHEARRLLADEGLVVQTKATTKPHPAVAIERDSRIALLRSLRQLGVCEDDVDDLRPPRINQRAKRH